MTPCNDSLEETDDEDGSTYPPSCPGIPGPEGGISLTQSGSIKMWSKDKDTKCTAGFVCIHDLSRGVFFAMPKRAQGDRPFHGIDAQDVIKGAITTLLDVAESCGARKITLGLGANHAGCAEFVCALLYLGFQVVQPRKSPFVNYALLLDLDIGWPADVINTCTSDCSTSAEDDIEKQVVQSFESD